jgi:hypothetical protein
MTHTSSTSRFLAASSAALCAAMFAAPSAAQSPYVQQAPPVRSFRPLASYSLPSGLAEIVDVTADGNALVFTNASDSELGVVDITNAAAPQLLATIQVNGEPTSVAVAGRYAYATVWVDAPAEGQPPPAFLPGKLVVVDLLDPANPAVVGAIDIGYHPDSVKAREIGGVTYCVVAVENQPVVVVNGLVTDDEEPGNPSDVSPAGLIQVVRVDPTNLAGATVTSLAIPAAALTAAGCYYPNDPQPEFVAWVGNVATVTLQENNGTAVLDMSNPDAPTLSRVFSNGIASSRPADLDEDADFGFDDVYPDDAPAVQDGGGNLLPAGLRYPDACAIAPDGSTIYFADEGEMNFTGGRGFSWFTPDGTFVADDAGVVEQTALVFSHYPEGRSANKGAEMEGCATARFGSRDFLFVSSERGSFVNVYDIRNAAEPRFVQLLPTGISPEGIVAIPSRRLLVTADEESGTLTLFEGVVGPYLPSPAQPVLYSADLATPWAALSGTCRGDLPFRFYAVPDNAVSPTRVYSVRTGLRFAPVNEVLTLTRNGTPVGYDGEGIARDTSIVAPANAGFWIGVEGNASSSPNLAVQIDATGAVLREIQLPFAIDAAADPALGGFAQPSAGGGKIRSNGFEGLTLSADGRFLYAAIQRGFVGEFGTGPRYTRIARYDLQQVANGSAPTNGLRIGGDWDFFFYELDSNDPTNWAGLSEVVALDGGELIVIERNQGIGIEATLKRIYRFSLNGLAPDADGAPGAGDTVTKVLIRDVLADFGPYEKIEGIVVGWFDDLWILMDNDGGELESRLKFFGFL